MKKLIALMVLLPLTVWAETLNPIKVAWDPNTEPDMASYRLYVGGELTATVPHPATSYTFTPSEEKTYVFHLTAVDQAGNESVPSNTVTVTIDVPPAPPTGCRAEVLP